MRHVANTLVLILRITNMMKNKILFISVTLSLVVLNSSVVSFSVLNQIPSEIDETTKAVEVSGDTEPRVIGDDQMSSRHGGRTAFALRDLFPTYFGEFFEIFVFFMELKWHYEVEDAISEAGEKFDHHHHHDGEVQHKDDNFLLDFAKHYFVNNNTPLWKFKA